MSDRDVFRLIGLCTVLAFESVPLRSSAQAAVGHYKVDIPRESLDAALVEPREGDATGRGVLTEQLAGDEESADHEEHVDADVPAGRSLDEVVGDDEQHRERSETLHIAAKRVAGGHVRRGWGGAHDPKRYERPPLLEGRRAERAVGAVRPALHSRRPDVTAPPGTADAPTGARRRSA